MISPIYNMAVSVPPINTAEVLRYSGCAKDTSLPLEQCISELKGLTYRVCYRIFDIKDTPDGIELGFASTESKDLKKCLSCCNQIILFAATIGPAPDRLIRRYSKLSPVKALLIQAIATERIEALCDAFCNYEKDEYEKRGFALKPRYSPGYGDLPLDIQNDVFKILDCNRQLGIVLNDRLLMMPSKSVTAIIGIYPKEI